MDEFFFALPIDSRKTLCIGPITRKEAANLPDSWLGDGTGLYLFLADTSARDEEINILARVGSCEAACALATMVRSGKLELAEC
jgi:hypothetical protein